MREVIPAVLHRTHADPQRIAIGGLSMGGFGALDIARLNPERFCAVGADSAAIWYRGADTAAGAFDDAADFARHDILVLAAAGNPYRRTPVWLDVGSSDPLRPQDTTLAADLRGDGARVQFTIWPGDHDQSYCNAHWERYMRFYARELLACHR